MVCFPLARDIFDYTSENNYKSVTAADTETLKSETEHQTTKRKDLFQNPFQYRGHGSPYRYRYACIQYA